MSDYTELLTGLAERIPAAVAVILVVFLFLRHNAKQAAESQERLMSAARDCHEVQTRGIDALIKHAEAASKQAEALSANSASLQQLILTVARCGGLSDTSEG